MFKDYKGIFKDLIGMQEQLWKDSMANFPGAAFPRDMNAWQAQTLENVNTLLGRAVNHSMELQREWLTQWSERAGGKNLKAKTFAELSAEAKESTERWLENQNQLWEQWLKFLRDSGEPAKLGEFSAWENAVNESIEAQLKLLGEWADMADYKKLSGKEVSKLTNQIFKAIESTIETQQKMWQHWFEDLSEATIPAVKSAAPAAKKPRAKAAKTTAQRKKTQAAGNDDLKQISGIGPGLESKLKDAGIATLKQIAELSDADVARLEEDIIRFSGRIKREKWVEQAKKLTR